MFSFYGLAIVTASYILRIFVTGPAKTDHVSANYTELYFLLISFVPNALSHFRKLQKKAH